MTLYITKKMALEFEYTHEGFAYGLPAWFDASLEDPDSFMLTCKAPWMNWWGDLCEFAYGMFTEFASMMNPEADFVIESPIYMTGAIK